MTSKKELLKKFKEERIVREKARIQMLHDMNLKKYSKNDENAWRYRKANNSSLNISNDKSPVENMHKRGPIFVRSVSGYLKRPRVKDCYRIFDENRLNVSTPVISNSNTSFPGDLAPKKLNIHSTTKHNSSFDNNNSPRSTANEANCN